MSPLSWRLVDRLSSVLQPDEREALHGDFAELGLTSGEALREFLGLIVRRQAMLWRSWRPWFVVVALVGLVGWRLSLFSFHMTAGLASYLLAPLRYGGRMHDGLTVTQQIVRAACECSLLVLYSWATGFVMGSLSSRTIWPNAALFYGFWLYTAHVPNLLYATRFAVMTVVAVMAQLVLFVGPSIAGIRRGLRHEAMTLHHASLLAALIGVAAAFEIQTEKWQGTALEVWSQGALRGQVPSPAYLASLAIMAWPAVYLVIVAISRRRHNVLLSI